jgi:hypothetical protein
MAVQLKPYFYFVFRYSTVSCLGMAGGRHS